MYPVMFDVALAGAPPQPPPEREAQVEEIVGFTTDERWLVLEATREVYTLYAPLATVRLAVAIDRDTSERKVWQLSTREIPHDTDDGDQRAELAAARTELATILALPDAAAYEAWRSEHPTARARSERTCGDASLDVSALPPTAFSAAPDAPAWNGDRFVAEDSAHLVITVERSNARWDVATFRQEPVTEFNSATVLMPAWSATCASLAWLELDPSAAPSRTEYVPSHHDRLLDVTFLPAGPRVRIVGAPDRSAAAVETLRAAGWDARPGKTTLPEKPGIVVYAWSKAMPAANAIAALLPGATVEAMPTQSRDDVVIAVGP